jgi:hypothetical protein
VRIDRGLWCGLRLSLVPRERVVSRLAQCWARQCAVGYACPGASHPCGCGGWLACECPFQLPRADCRVSLICAKVGTALQISLLRWLVVGRVHARNRVSSEMAPILREWVGASREHRRKCPTSLAARALLYNNRTNQPRVHQNHRVRIMGGMTCQSPCCYAPR